MEVYRGDIFYISKGKTRTYGSEQEPDRPAVIVSNNTGNHFAPVVEVVYLTTQEKNPMPTHVDVMCHVPSVALCEQIFTVYKDRLGGYIRSCTEKEMKEIDNALMISLGLDVDESTFEEAAHELVNELKKKLEDERKYSDKLREESIEMKKELDELKCQPVFTPDPEEVVKLKAQVEMLERQNEKLLDRLVG